MRRVKVYVECNGCGRSPVRTAGVRNLQVRSAGWKSRRRHRTASSWGSDRFWPGAQSDIHNLVQAGDVDGGEMDCGKLCVFLHVIGYITRSKCTRHSPPRHERGTKGLMRTQVTNQSFSMRARCCFVSYLEPHKAGVQRTPDRVIWHLNGCTGLDERPAVCWVLLRCVV